MVSFPQCAWVLSICLALLNPIGLWSQIESGSRDRFNLNASDAEIRELGFNFFDQGNRTNNSPPAVRVAMLPQGSDPRKAITDGSVTNPIIHEEEKKPVPPKKSLKIGGYTKLDYIHDFHSAVVGSNSEHFNNYALIPLDGTPEADLSNAVLTARESRIFVDTVTETVYGTLSTKFEGDFFGSYSSEKLVQSFGFPNPSSVWRSKGFSSRPGLQHVHGSGSNS